MQRTTGAPLDQSPGGEPAAPAPFERWKLPITTALLLLAVVGVALWLMRRPVEQPIAFPTPGAEAARQIKVHVTGAVARPGLLTMAGGSRVSDALREAGGALPEADTNRINLAAPLKDGQQLVVPAAPTPRSPAPSAPAAAVPAAPPTSAAAVPAGEGATPSPNASTRAAPARARPTAPRPDARLNLNRATAAELEALPGIGPVTARRIIEHREKNGPFQAVDDLRTTRLLTARTWEQVKELVEAP